MTWNTRNKTYGQAASDMRALGRQLQFVANNLMMKRRVRRRQIWCIGHGLGAQACGISGKVVPLGRITGTSFLRHEWSYNVNYLPNKYHFHSTEICVSAAPLCCVVLCCVVLCCVVLCWPKECRELLRCKNLSW